MSVSRNVMWGKLRGMRKVETAEQMPAEYRETLLKIIYALASTEFAPVEQHQPWLNRGRKTSTSRSQRSGSRFRTRL